MSATRRKAAGMTVEGCRTDRHRSLVPRNRSRSWCRSRASSCGRSFTARHVSRRVARAAKRDGFSDVQLAHLAGLHRSSRSASGASRRSSPGVQARRYLRGRVRRRDALLYSTYEEE